MIPFVTLEVPFDLSGEVLAQVGKGAGIVSIVNIIARNVFKDSPGASNGATILGLAGLPFGPLGVLAGIVTGAGLGKVYDAAAEDPHKHVHLKIWCARGNHFRIICLKDH